MDKITTPPPRAFCEICGERIAGQAHHGGRVKHGGTRYVHKECWEREQAELAREAEQ